jgi:hypothetical protein
MMTLAAIKNNIYSEQSANSPHSSVKNEGENRLSFAYGLTYGIRFSYIHIHGCEGEDIWKVLEVK